MSGEIVRDELVERYEHDHPLWATLKPFFNGGSAGMLSCCLVQPLDTLKVHKPRRLAPLQILLCSVPSACFGKSGARAPPSCRCGCSLEISSAAPRQSRGEWSSEKALVHSIAASQQARHLDSRQEQSLVSGG